MSVATIRIQYPDGRLEDRPLGLGEHRIGRDEGEIVLHDSNVSSRHAELQISAAGVLVRDVGSTNGTFDMHSNRISVPQPLRLNEAIRLGNCTIWLVHWQAGAVPRTQLMNQFDPAQPQGAHGHGAPQHAPAAAPAHAPRVPAPGDAAPAPAYVPAAAPVAYAAQPHAPGYGPQVLASVPARDGRERVSANSGHYSHPDQGIRHSYPVLPSSFGFSAAAGLMMKTAPFVGARLAILIGLSTLGLIYSIIVITGFVFFANRSPIVGWGWLIVTLGAFGWLWRGLVRYFLYLLKAGQIAVLTELITTGQVAHGSMGMFAYGKGVVRERFGEVNVLFAMDLLIDGVVRAFNRTLDWIGSLLPIPGLDSILGPVKAVISASTTYIDETIFSYNLARGDANAFRSSKDALIYYAQNSKEVLKTGVWVVILEKVLSFLVFLLVFVPALGVAYMLPASIGSWPVIIALVAGFLFAADVQQAILRPLFLTMILLKFHSVVRGQPINLEWDQRLEGISDKFRQLKTQAEGWVAGTPRQEPTAHPTPAE